MNNPKCELSPELMNTCRQVYSMYITLVDKMEFKNDHDKIYVKSVVEKFQKFLEIHKINY
jgi:hypothetical protein